MSETQLLLRGLYSSCLEPCLRFVCFLCDPFLYPFPYMISMHNRCARTTPAFPLPVSSSEPAFRRKEIYKPFIHSFIPFLPPCLQNEQEAICAWWLTIRFYEGICWTSLIHTLLALSEVNVLAAFPCKCRTSTKLLISRALSYFCLPWYCLHILLRTVVNRGTRWHSVSVLNREISWHSVGARVPAQQQPPPLPFTLRHALIFTFLNSKSCWDEHIESD